MPLYNPSGSSSGNVTKVGTPVNKQVGVWTGDGTIQGDAALTYDPATDTLTSVTFAGNLTGNASTVTTNANLTGDVTSTGNATALAAATVTGKALTGFSSGASTVAATDTILQGFNKVDGNLRAMLGQYRMLLTASGSHTAAKVAGTYLLSINPAVLVTGGTQVNPLSIITIRSTDYPTISGLAPKFRIAAECNVNDVAPTGNFTFGLYPLTRPATSGGAGLLAYTVGSVVSGSNGATFTAPAADSSASATSSDFALPANGIYCIAVVTTATVAASSHVHLNAQLSVHNA